VRPDHIKSKNFIDTNKKLSPNLMFVYND